METDVAKISFGSDEEDYTYTNPRNMYERDIFKNVLINEERVGRFRRGSVPYRLAEKYRQKEMPDNVASVLLWWGRNANGRPIKFPPFPRRLYYAGENLPPTRLERFDAHMPRKILPCVDYSRSFKQMFDAGHYTWGHGGYSSTPGWDDATVKYLSKHFPLSGQGIEQFEGKLFYFRSCTARGAIRAIRGKGYEPARIEHLLALGEQYPETKRSYTIIALGSVAKIRERFNARVLPHSPILSDYSGRHLGTSPWGGGWNDGCCYLGVRKVHS